jgi:hypothetical protein
VEARRRWCTWHHRSGSCHQICHPVAFFIPPPVSQFWSREQAVEGFSSPAGFLWSRGKAPRFGLMLQFLLPMHTVFIALLVHYPLLFLCWCIWLACVLFPITAASPLGLQFLLLLFGSRLLLALLFWPYRRRVSRSVHRVLEGCSG